MTPKDFERQTYYFLESIFEKVEWLSKNNTSPIDFKCYLNDKVYLIECKLITNNNKIRLLPTQKNVDAIVFNEENECRLIWKKDFKDLVFYDKMCLVKVSESVKDKLDSLKKYRRETYDDTLREVLNIE